MLQKILLKFLASIWHSIWANNGVTNLGSSCGTVVKAAVSDNRNLRFESSQWQFYLPSTVLNKLHWKDKNKERGGRELLI